MNRTRPTLAGLKILAALAPALVAAPMYAQTSTLSFSGDGLGLIFFKGMDQSSAIAFSGNSADFKVANSSDPSLDGLTGTITSNACNPLAIVGGPNGSNVSTTFVSIPNGPTLEEQAAPITGSGLLTIADGEGHVFKANISWNDIVTSSTVGLPTLGSSGELISTDPSTPNLSQISYSGGNPGLLDLARSGGAFETLSFQFEPGKLLTQLLAECSTSATTFSESTISEPFIAIPEPACWSVAVGIAAGLVALSRHRPVSRRAA